MTDADESLAVRAAWLHYVAGMTQAEVARRLGLPSVKTHRMIARAVADGVVKVTIDGDEWQQDQDSEGDHMHQAADIVYPLAQRQTAHCGYHHCRDQNNADQYD